MPAQRDKPLPTLDLRELKRTAADYARLLSDERVAKLFGTTDGKAVGTYVEAGFHAHLGARFAYETGNAASGIDFPGLGVDLKVTSSRQPQSSSPFRDATQKVYGLGYHILLFVYAKNDDFESRTTVLDIRHAIFVGPERTGDYQTTVGLAEILDRGGNGDDIDAFLEERMLPLDEIGRRDLAERILRDRPPIGYLTVSNALQWRLQYGHVVRLVEQRANGLEDLFTH